MDLILNVVPNLLFSGLSNLAAYLAAHVLLCLLPAFFIAGAMTAFIPKEIITRYLGRNTPKYISYPAAAAGGFLLAVCSCTVIPLFAGIYKKGAGLGPAITFLFVAPAVNILAITYTGTVIGLDLALARLFLSLLFGIAIGLIMAAIFKKEDKNHDEETDTLFTARASMRPAALAFLLILIALLLFGTLQIDLLKNTYFSFNIPLNGVDRLQSTLSSLIPYDAVKGEEGVTVQGVFLIAMLFLIGFSAWKGFEKIHERFNSWTWISVGLVGFTLFTAAVGMTPAASGLVVQITGKSIGVLVSIFILAWLMRKKLNQQEIRDFLWESWKFIKQIFPLLLVGVFVVGIIRDLINPVWIETLAGSNTVMGNFIGVVFGIFMYFPTLVEVPIARMFLSLGMHKGPLLAYLLSDPELSLQSILITATIIGKKKAWIYVALVALFSTFSGLLYGAWVDGIQFGSLAPYILGILVISGILYWFIRKGKAAEKE